MAFSLDQVVPWGRCFDEYKDMFSLTSYDLSKKIIGVGDGPASFNFEATAMEARITSVDPIYQFTRDDIKTRIDETYDVVMKQLESNQHQFAWDVIKSPKELGATRLNSMNVFLDDFETGLEEKRYVAGCLPELQFEDNSFDLALVSHFLFLYSDQMDFQFHLDSINEILRISNETRIFPLIKLDGTKSQPVEKIIDSLKNKFDITIQKTDYHFQLGADEMMIIKR